MSKYLCREGNRFLFRRRVPEHLQDRMGCKEIYRSLKTSVPRKARQRAAFLFLASERLFALAEYEITDEDMRAAARLWLSHDDWQGRLKQAVDDKAPGYLRGFADEIPTRLMEGLADPEEGLGPRGARLHEAMAALEFAEYGWQRDNDVLERMAGIMTDLIKEHVDKRMQQVFRPADPAMVAPVQPASAAVTLSSDKTPLISEHVEEWLSEIQKDSEDGSRKAIPAHHAGQKRVSIRLLTELLGDRPAGTITREDAAMFRLQLLKLPSSHGKGRYRHALEAIAATAGMTEKRYTLKTVKRHFSAIKGYWEWLRDKKLIPDGPIPFAGHKFPGTKSSKSNRDDWSIQDLERLFKSPDYLSYPWESAFHWLPLIALHSGMRLEEIARLRTEEDIVFEGKVACFKVQVHADGWDPKTEAGERSIPIHSWLISHGLMKLVEQRREKGSFRLFSDLSIQGEAGKLGAGFSRDFSRLKIALGVSGKTVFHSFRHTFRTEVDEAAEERFIDAIMGHEGRRGEGATYNKRFALRKRQQVVESFCSPLPLDFLGKEGAPSRPVRVRKVRLEPRTTV